ncbi:hypothetical protein [Lelliottia sp. RWM.1]|uniref:hypothetical protein n=1 Tax=Lelliottia sp. RWM.1 TaxID=2663242 RepID=UPI001EEFA783|nr:hypothetical protein [Lelliottia sp. RWM.1]MBM3074434.1 hypothetical protein [Lelliottia sp. RWM.1]
MITYITDQRSGETNILDGLELASLEVRDLAGNTLLNVDAPHGGWTHESLSSVQPHAATGGADVYLNGNWIGSTEV